MEETRNWISKTTLREICLETVMIVLISVLLAVGVNDVRSSGGISFFANESESGGNGEPGGEMSLEAAVEKFEQGKALFADARPSEAYEAGHIQNALSLPVYEFDSWIDDFFSSTSPETEIITYCDGDHCSLALDLTEKLLEVGFDNVFYVKNGFTRWQERGLPVEEE